MPISNYTKFEAKTNNYTLDPTDGVVVFTITAGKTATLPLARTCNQFNGLSMKIIANAAGSSNTLTLAVQSGDTLIGGTASGPATTLAAGETAFAYSDGILTWSVSGGAGVSGTSGISGGSGKSGFTGVSGTSGFSGVAGFSGISGFSGTSGFAGATGASGASGAEGVSGASGASGVSGFSGASGVSKV